MGEIRQNIFAKMRARLQPEPEPEPRSSPEWTAWNLRDARRRYRLAEIAEAQALTTYPEDPAPIASLGLGPFIAWVCRQKERRQARRRKPRA